MKNLFKNVGLAILGVFAVVGLGAKTTFAAADPLFATVQASSTEWLTDNMSAIFGVFMAWALPVLGLVIVILLFMRGSRMLKGGVGGGRKKRR